MTPVSYFMRRLIKIPGFPFKEMNDDENEVLFACFFFPASEHPGGTVQRGNEI
jgi:hypothetical protein